MLKPPLGDEIQHLHIEIKALWMLLDFCEIELN